MDQRILEEIGLANSEIKVYRALLRTGSVRVGELMKEVTLHRSRVYDAINRLIEKGLVSYFIRNNIKYFEASDPEKLVSYIEEQREKLNQKEKSVKRLIPELRKRVSPMKPHAEAHVFLGKEGFKAVRKDVLRQGQDIYMIGAIGKEDEYVKYFFPGFDRERVKNNMKWKMLFDHEVRNKKMTKLGLMDCRFLPKGFSTPAIVNIYGDRVVTVLWKGDEPICFMLINKEIADSYRKWFELMWNISEG